MRIIAGKLGGRSFDSPRGHRTHPMSDKARGALFNALGDVNGLRFLDAFAGSGGLAFEAVSRGAKSAIAVEIDKSAHKTIVENIAKLGLAESVKAVRANVTGWSANNPNARFDLVVCDPPYDDLKPGSIERLVCHIVENGLLVLSWPSRLSIPEFSGLIVIRQLSFGDAQLIIYKPS